jgi:GWxTD domain-containing protein
MTRHTFRLLRLAPAVLLALTGAAGAAAPASGADLLDRPDPRWRQGPVRYLLTRDEDARFRRLKSEDERRAFVVEFWAKRDPTPGTPKNEFKETYVRRLELVAATFPPPEGRGWEEDRGRVTLLLGAPDQVEVIESQEPGPAAAGDEGTDPSAAPAARKKAVFVYRREVVPGAANPLRLDFIQESSGGFRLLTRFDVAHPRLTGLEPVPPPAPPAPPEAAAPVAPPPPEPAVAEPPPPPTAGQALLDGIAGGARPPSKIPLVARVDYYKTAEAGTRVAITLSAKRPASGAAPVVAARAAGSGDEVALRLDRDDSFTPAPENAAAGADGESIFQAGQDLPAGRYSLVAALREPESGDVGFVIQEIEVPDFHTEALQISSVTLARKVERLSGPPADPLTPYVLGGSRVVPAPTARFRAGQGVWVYYQIYNTASDPNSGQPRLKVTYRYEKVEKAGNRLLGGRPIEQNVSNSVQAYVVTVQPAWPAGDYQVVVKVEDLVAGSSASAAVPFTVVK